MFKISPRPDGWLLLTSLGAQKAKGLVDVQCSRQMHTYKSKMDIDDLSMQREDK